MTSDELKALLYSSRSQEAEHAIEYLVAALTDRDERARKHGYALLDGALKEALYQSCLNYGSLLGSFTQPLMTVMTRAVEAWAAQQHDAIL